FVASLTTNAEFTRGQHSKAWTPNFLMKKLRNKIWAGLAVAVGWWLSPLTWWNDAFVNLPIAWLVASLFARGNRTALLIGVNVVYWMTNVLGFLLMHWGGQDLFKKGEAGEKKPLK